MEDEEIMKRAADALEESRKRDILGELDQEMDSIRSLQQTLEEDTSEVSQEKGKGKGKKSTK